MLQPLQVKVCGITQPKDARAAVEAGASHIGMIFAPASPRRVSMGQARVIADTVRAEARIVGVFQGGGDETIEDALTLIQTIADAVGLEMIQLHGGFPPELSRALAPLNRKIIEAVPVDAQGQWRPRDTPADWLLLDRAKGGAFGGTGTTFPWSDTRRPARNFFVAGGLRPDNIIEAVRKLRPDGIDLSSGVESAPGVKDPAKLNELAEVVKQLRPQAPRGS